MTTDNPDPLEVLKDDVRRQIRAYHVTRQTYDGPGKTRGRRMHSGDDAAATAILAIIAQHYAPVIAREARLREEMRALSKVLAEHLGGGSEWFKQIGDEFFVDAAAVGPELRRRKTDAQVTKKALFRANKLLGAKP